MFLRYLVALALAGVLLPLGIGAVSGAWTDVVLGGAASLIGGLTGLWLVHRALRRPSGVNPLLGAIVIAILLRIVLLGAGLLFSVVFIEERPILFVASFFAVHMVSQILEALYVHQSGRARQAHA